MSSSEDEEDYNEEEEEDDEEDFEVEDQDLNDEDDHNEERSLSDDDDFEVQSLPKKRTLNSKETQRKSSKIIAPPKTTTSKVKPKRKKENSLIANEDDEIEIKTPKEQASNEKVEELMDIQFSEAETSIQSNENLSNEKDENVTENFTENNEENNGETQDGDDQNIAKKKKKKGAISRELKAIMRGEGPRAKILHVMYKKNRPGNVSTIENFTGHKIPKGVVQQVLEDFAKSGELKMKDNNGKNKIYWFNQDHFRSKGLNVSKILKDIDENKEKLGEYEDEEQGLIKALRKLESEPSDEDLENKIIELTERKKELELQVDTLKANAIILTPIEKELMKKKFTTYRDAWVKRKRQCSDAVGDIADAMEKKQKDAENIIGIETDEGSNVMLPPPLPKLQTSKFNNIIRKPPSGSGGGGKIIKKK
mmetsp:Transcript_39255/g.50706  ORF Transcript_39255/g.50706 Transcript_39255/m.50706 type:complete len:422 (-) Transcript_39255:222-1487(-)